ncbi:ferrochelatase [Thermomonas brevis]|uniref:Ferrochelatase n=1 Tax=Thermomonas brevis TaxID=215691 RepID=A0A7G9QXG6_9GAMM|nr:ferrochelatase [Thermomonas brevis]QNN48041.1 ferrochelatase [Thermomonas brevis]
MPQATDTALILANLGTPAAPTAPAVAAYLDEFLSDPRVVQLPRWLWRPLLRRVILPRRSPVVAEKYAEIWLPGGSPLAVHTRALAQAVQQRLPDWRVEHAMRYGAPSLADTLQRLRMDDVRRVRVLPLYPQYSTTTTASVADAVAAHGSGMQVELLHDYHADAGWAAAVAASIRAHWDAHGRGERLLLSFHGIPQRLVDRGDPYATQCEGSARAIADALGIAREEIVLTYQSRFGRERWLQPYTMPTLQQLARDGVRRIDVACPGFAVDCLETLEEIAMQNAEAFQQAGGQALRYIPCLNADAAHAGALASLAQRDAGWR